MKFNDSVKTSTNKLPKKHTKRVKYYTELMGPYEFLLDAQYSSADQDDDFKGEIEIDPNILEKLVEKFDELGSVIFFV
ncbi:hypothetical protein [Paenibacillus validus]|uniref:Uncharacterized protein n=1 Tax=Paenibacillus validus TaxID=44253 RepID=A0A7X3CUF9_9BACL|nr:hypothetical protein [Paenibacillus validus]MUG73840.1 hypothetical protein [Paenibacillus validus]